MCDREDESDSASESESEGDEDSITLDERNLKDSSSIDDSLPDQETKAPSNTTTPTKRVKVDTKIKRDKQQRTNRHTVNKCSRGKIINNNNSLHDFGFTFEAKKKAIENNKLIHYNQDYLSIKQLTIPNEAKGYPMITKSSSSIRICYINIHGTDQLIDEHSLLQLCSSLKTKDVNAICLTETNIDWEKPHLVNQFQRILNKTWPKQKI